MYVGTNSDGDSAGVEDFVEIYAKTAVAQKDGDLAGTGTRLFVCPGSAGGVGINVANTQAWDVESGLAACDVKFTNLGLSIGSATAGLSPKIAPGLVVLSNGVAEDMTPKEATISTNTIETRFMNLIDPDGNSHMFQWSEDYADAGYMLDANFIITGNLQVLGTINGNGSHTLTHKTNIINFKPDQIGCFRETTGEIADVYGSDYTPSLDRSCDCICKVKSSNVLNARVIGIITDYDRFANSGDVLVRVVDDVYSLGDLLVPDVSGLCRKCVDEGERLTLVLSGCPRAKITTIIPGGEFVACFLQ
jgi:hypothetical protein